MVTLPPVGVLAPLLGPAVVFAAAEAAGYKAKQIDFNLDFFLKNPDPIVAEWINFDSYISNKSKQIMKFLEPSIEEWVTLISQENPRWVGFSVFSFRCKFILDKILPILKKRCPQVKIAVGGSGIINTDYFEQMRQQEMIAAYVTGEGEEAIVNILKNNLDAPGINNNPPTQIADLNSIEIANYRGLKIEEYGKVGLRKSKPLSQKYNIFYVEASRGCVRKCSFCDVPFMKSGFRYRSTESIMKEINQLVVEHQANVIYFVDSLVNGSLRQLKELCTAFTDLKQNEKKSLSWMGYFIVRGEKSFPTENFDMLKKSGAIQIKLGIESGSEKVRKDMNKSITNEEINYNLREFRRVGIDVCGLIMIGFPTETEADYEQTKKLIIENQESFKSTMGGLSISWKVGINEHKSDIGFNPKKYGVNYDANNEWYSDNVNILITSKRYLDICNLCDQLGLINKQKYSKQRVLDAVAQYGISESDLELSEETLKKMYLSYINKVV